MEIPTLKSEEQNSENLGATATYPLWRRDVVGTLPGDERWFAGRRSPNSDTSRVPGS